MSGGAGDRPPRFVADAMLGSLARWLRVLGLDVVYDPELDDTAIVDRAVAEGRIVLTRDRRLVERRLAAGRHLLVTAEELGEQLREVLDGCGVKPRREELFTRCLRCNEPLEAADRDVARRRVPAYVARTQERYRRCPICGRLFWSATHVDRMRRRLAELGLEIAW